MMQIVLFISDLIPGYNIKRHSSFCLSSQPSYAMCVVANVVRLPAFPGRFRAIFIYFYGKVNTVFSGMQPFSLRLFQIYESHQAWGSFHLRLL